MKFNRMALSPAITTPRVGAGQAHTGARTAPAVASDRHWQIRLAITIPVVLMLFTIIFGLVSYLAFSKHWDELQAAGAYTVASELLRTHLITMIVLTVIAGLMGVVLSISILRPVRAIERVAEQVALGNLAEYAPAMPAAPELEGLSRSFNTMLDHLNDSIRERDRRLMEGIPLGILITDLNGVITAASPSAVDMLGLPDERLIGSLLSEMLPLLPTASRPLAADMLEMLERKRPLTAHEIKLPPLLDGHAPGGERAIQMAAAWLRDPAQTPTGVLFSFRDASPLHMLSEHLGRTDRLAALGTFCLGLAHELRNPLGAIKGLSQLLQLERELPENTQLYLQRMVHEIDRVDAFVRQLLALADQPSTLQPTDVTLVLDEAIALARQEIMHAGKEQKLAEVRLERLIDPLPPLMLEGARLAQAFARILQNAWEFTPAGGTITLAAAPAWDGGVGRCEVRIHNTGSAVAAHMMEKIFEPFVTTRDRATGLGLTIANQIIAQNGGTLGVHNEADGVSFVATFDLARVARPGDAAAHTALATGGKGPC